MFQLFCTYCVHFCENSIKKIMLFECFSKKGRFQKKAETLAPQFSAMVIFILLMSGLTKFPCDWCN